MSYMTISKCVADNDFTSRVTACAAQEGTNPYSLPNDLMWDVATQSDIEQAYAYALEAGTPTPGADETVITDQMILSHVQAILNPPPIEIPQQQPS